MNLMRRAEPMPTLGESLRAIPDPPRAERASPENPSTNLSNPDSWLVEWATGGGPTQAGVTVGPETAMRCAAVKACVRIVSEDFSTLPVGVFEDLENGGKRKALDHPLYPVLHDEPNPDTSSVVWREQSQSHVEIRGNSYNYIEYAGNGKVRALWPLHPEWVEPFRSPSGELAYRFTQPGGGIDTLPAWQVLHIPGCGWDGLRGRNPIADARETVGLALATSEFGSRYFSNGSSPRGFLSTDQPMGPKEREENRLDFEAAHRGLERSHRVAFLSRGIKWNAIGISPEDSQFLETRRFQVAEIARMWRVPLVMLDEHEKAASYASVEQFLIMYVRGTLRPRVVKWESEMNRKLFSASQRGRFYVKFNLDALLRADTATRFEAYFKAAGGPWMNRNQVRELEDMPPMDGLDEMVPPPNTAGAPQGKAA